MLLRSFAYLPLVLSLAWCLSSVEARAAEQAEAASFLTGLSERAVAQLTDAGVPEDERERRFRALLNEGFDIPLIGRFVLARYWRGATEEERQGFLSTFEDMIVQRFLPMFADHKGERFTVTEVHTDPSRPELVTAYTEIIGPRGAPAQVAWRIHDANGQHKIIDVLVEKVSMVITLRSEYGSFIQRHGGSVSALVDGLRQQLAQKAFAPKTN